MTSIRQIIGNAANYLKTHKDLADAATTLVVRIVAAVFAFGVQAYLARMLGLVEYGVYVSLWTWLIIANHLSVFGFSESSLRFLPRYSERKQYHWAIGFLKTGFLFSTIGATVLGIGGFIFLSIFGEVIAPQYLTATMVLAIGLPVMTLELYLEGVSRSFGWYMLTIVPAYVVRPILIAAGVFAAYGLGISPTAAVVLGIAVAITCAIVVGQSLVIWSRIRKQFGFVKHSQPRKIWVSASLSLIFSTGVDQLYFWSDILILAFMMPTPEVAIYFAAQRSMALANFIHYAFMMVSSREFSIANAMRDKKELQNRISHSTRWTFWLTVPAVAITYVAGYPLLRIFGPEFVSGLQVMAVLGIGLIVRASVGQATELLVVLGHQKANLYVATGGMLFNVVLSILLVPSFGIMGVAYATTVTFLLRSVALVVIAKKLTGLWVLTDLPKPFPVADKTSQANNLASDKK